MSAIKRLDEARVATVTRSDSGFHSNRSHIARVGSSQTIELIEGGNPFSPLGNEAPNSTALTHLNHDDAVLSDTFPDQEEHERKVMTSKEPPRNLWRIIAVCVWNAAGGWSDAAPGALLPHIEDYYHINYTVVSLIWMANAAGFILIACLSHKIQPWLGKRYSMVAGCGLSCIMYSIVSSGTKFPLIVIGFFCGGMGLATCLAQGNVFLANFDKLSKYLSFCHALYGLGATISPLIATSMVNAGIKWHYFYLTILGLMILNATNFFLAFKGADEDLKPWDPDTSHENIRPTSESSGTRRSQIPIEGAIGLQDFAASGNNATKKKTPAVNHTQDMILALKNYKTWTIAFFLLFYQGSEVSFAGWIVTFLLDYRKGNPALVGYVASGFWGGLTVGRLLLTSPVHKQIGARRGIIVLSLMAILLVVLIWVIPNAIVEGVLSAFAGVAIGPNYPLQITLTTRLIPRRIQVISLTIITAFGSSGGAIFPFLVGLISQKFGSFVVLPIFIILYSLMLFLWICLPNVERKREPGQRLNIFQKLW